MKKRLKSWLLLNSFNSQLKQGKYSLILFLVFLTVKIFPQVNFVGNPSLETLISCTGPNYLAKAKYWNALDSAFFACGGNYYNTCFGNVPKGGPGLFQYPRTGNAFVRVTFYCVSNCRTHPKNRLVNNLVAGKTYCVKMYLNLQNNSPNSLDSFGIYFSDSSADTITKCFVPLTYLTPQIQNSPSNFITDTLGWVEVKGTFTATGNEKYLVIGNFKTDAATTTSATGVGSGNWSEYNVDDVSVIDFNLPAYAGPDKNIFLGDSTFIGRPPEIGLDCTWSTGTVTVGDSAGIWVKPTTPGTYSYVVTQNICGNIKTDTVNINVSPGSVNENTLFANSIGIYPQPAKDVVNISLSYFYEPTVSVKIIDVNGREILIKELLVSNYKTTLSTKNISSGVYILQIISKNQIAQKRLIIVY